MTRAFLALLLILGNVPVAEAARRRTVQPPAPVVAPAAILVAATEASEAALKAAN